MFSNRTQNIFNYSISAEQLRKELNNKKVAASILREFTDLIKSKLEQKPEIIQKINKILDEIVITTGEYNYSTGEYETKPLTNKLIEEHQAPNLNFKVKNKTKQYKKCR